MTQGQINALFAAGQLSPEEAASKVMEARTKKPRGLKRFAGHPVMMLCALLVTVVGSIFGVRSND